MTLVQERHAAAPQPQLPPSETGSPPSRELFAYVGLVVLGFLLRIYDLGSRALHHDESLHAVYSWYLATGRGYVHDPMMHGPFQFHATALIYFLFGASDATARLLPVLAGTALIATPYLLRRELGRAGALAAAVLLTFSPSFLYFSRFVRNDIYTALWTMLILAGLFGYLRTQERRWIYLAAAAFALNFATKETSFITAFIFATFVGIAAAAGLLLDARDRLRESPLAQEARRVWQVVRSVPAAVWVVSLLVFLAINFVLYTTFLTNLRGLCTMLWNPGLDACGGVRGALQYWLDQQGVRRGGQPWFYYFMLVPLYETLPLVLALAAVFFLRGRRTIFFWFLLYWTVLAFAIYSWAGEKMPWLIVNLALPLLLLAALFLGRWIDGLDPRRLVSGPSLWAGGLALTLGAVLVAFVGLSAASTLAPLDVQMLGLQRLAYGLVLTGLVAGLVVLWRRHGGATVRPALLAALLTVLGFFTIHTAWQVTYKNGDVPVELLVYVQTSPDVPWVVSQIEQIGMQTGQGKDVKILLDGGWNDGTHESIAWPFEWYLRDYKQRRYYTRTFGSDVDLTQYPVILAMAPNVEPIRNQLGDYHGQKYRLNWWYPEDYKSLVAEPPTVAGIRLPIPWLKWSAVFEALTDPTKRAKLLNYVVNRELINPPLGAREFYFYVRNDVPGIGPAGLPAGAATTTASPQPTRPAGRPLGPPLALAGPVAQLGLAGGQPALDEPKGLAIGPDGRVYVVEGRANRVTVFNADGSVAFQFGRPGSGEGEFKEPWGLAVAPDGEIYVADTWNHRVQRFDAQGRFLGQWGGLADARGRADASPGLFWGPRDIAIGADGSVYVADTGNKRIQVFDRSGRFLRSLGGEGGDPGQLREPVGLALDREGNLYVADAWNGRIQRLAPDGRPLGEWSVPGWESRSVTNKPYLALDTRGRVLATLPELGQVVALEPNGEVRPLSWEASAAAVLPTGVRVGPSGEIYVSDSGGGVVLRLPSPG